MASIRTSSLIFCRLTVTIGLSIVLIAGMEVSIKIARLRRPIIALLLLAAVAAGVWFWHSRQRTPSVNELIVYGNVDIRQVQLAFNGSQRIASMAAKEGDRVSKGQLLATLETQRLEQTVGRVAGQAQAQKEVVARLEAGSRPEEIRKTRADVEAARADAYNAALTHRRMETLAAKDAVPQQRADDAKAAAEATEARLNAARETLRLAVEGPRKEDIASAKATLRGYEAELAFAKRELADASLYAPVDGIIQDRILEPGDMASPQRPVYTVALIDPLWVRTYVSEPDLGKIRPGMIAEVRTDSYPGKRYRAWIGFISPTAEFTPKAVETPQVRTSLVYQVRVHVCNPQNELRLGMPATVLIRLDQETKGTPAPDPCSTP